MRAHQLSDHVKAKWPVGTLSEGFVPLPKKLLRCTHQLFAGHGAIEDLAVVLALVDYERPAISRPPSREYVAFVAGLTVARLNAALKRLQLAGYVEVEVDDQGRLATDLAGLNDAIEQAAQAQED